MKNIILILILTNFSFLFGQSDTIKVVTLQDFNIPTVFHHVTKVSHLDIEVFKSTSNGTIKVSSKNFAFNQTPTDRELKTLTDEYHGLGPSVQIIVNGFLQEIGDYKITIRLKSLGDFKEPNPIKRNTFYVKVGYPKLLAWRYFRDEYYLESEDEIDLNMSGLTNIDKYSYEITESESGNLLKKDSGPIVKLDGAVISGNKSKLLNIKLFYNNIIFSFLTNPDSLNSYSSDMKDVISIIKPKLIISSFWDNTGKLDPPPPIVFNNNKSLEIKLSYSGGKVGLLYKFIKMEVITPPRVEYSSENQNGYTNNLVEIDYNSSDANYKPWEDNSDFNGIKINLRPTKFYESLEDFKTYKTKFKVILETQYGNETIDFNALIYK